MGNKLKWFLSYGRMNLLFSIIILLSAQIAFGEASLSITPITWNVVGLHHNKPQIGPDTFPVGVRITNTGNETATNAQAHFIWDSNNNYIKLHPNTPSTLSGGNLEPGQSRDIHFYVIITRNKNAYSKARRYHITATADGIGVVSTPVPREIYVMKLVPNDSNAIVEIYGEQDLYVGKVYKYVLHSHIAAGSVQAQHHAFFPENIFRIISTEVFYSEPTGVYSDKLYADACGWDNNPLNRRTYLSCIGPCEFEGCKVGGDVISTYTVQLIDSGSANITTLLHNLVGSQYHYNADFGSAYNILPIEAVYPPTISGHIFNDLNGNGAQEIHEPGLENIEVLVTAANGELFVLYTNSSGDFFTPVYAEGETTVDIIENTLPEGSVMTTGSDPQVVIAINETNSPTETVGYQQQGTVTGHIFNDVNGNGIQDTGEPDLAGVTVNITDSQAQIHAIETDGSGNYSIAIAIGDTEVDIDDADADLPPGPYLTTGIDPISFILLPTQIVINPPAGYQQRNALISGIIWEDLNADGGIGADEPRYQNLPVTLTGAGPDGALGTGDDITLILNTNSSGAYSFERLPGNPYMVDIDNALIPATHILTTTGEPLSVTLAPGEERIDANFGYVSAVFRKKAAVLWSDINARGILDVGDTLAYEIEITNPSPTTGFTMDIRDALPSGLAGLDYLSVPDGADITASNSSLVHIENLALIPKSTETIIYTCIVTRDAVNGSIIVNTATGDLNDDGLAEFSETTSTDPVTNTETPPSLGDYCGQIYVILPEAGDGKGGHDGDHGPALDAQLYYPMQAATDAYNNAYVADYSNHVVRKIDGQSGVIITIAGIPHVRGYSGDGGLAVEATLGLPSDVWARGTSLYIAELGNSVIRKVDLITGVISTVAGNGTEGYTGDGGLATDAQLYRPRSVFVDVAGNIYIGDTFNYCIRKVDALTGIIETIAGNGTAGHTEDGQPAQGSSLEWIHDVVTDMDGVLYFSEQGPYNIIRRIVDGRLETVAGQYGFGSVEFCGPSQESQLNKPYSIAFDTYNNLYIADQNNHKILKIEAQTGYLHTIAGTGAAGYNYDFCLGVYALLNYPTGVAVGSDNVLHIVDRYNHRIRKIDLEDLRNTGEFPGAEAGNIETIAGMGVYGFDGDGVDARYHLLSHPGGITIDADGNVILADRSNHRVRRIYTSWYLKTLAGSGFYRGYFGDGGPATLCTMNFPTDVAIDAGGNIYVSDQYNNVIRRISATGIITTVAGTGTAGFSGDGGSAVSAELNFPDGLALSGNLLYISDRYNHRVRMMDIVSGIITTVAGNGMAGQGGELVDALTTPLDTPRGLAVAADGSVYIAAFGAQKVRKLAPDGLITTVAGNGWAGYEGDGGLAINARLNQPVDVCLDTTGTLFIADYRNHAVRKVDAVTSLITTVIGVPGAPGYAGDGGAASAALLNYPVSIAFNHNGDLYISDRMNHVIRVVGH
ncbi:hypothetical protein JW926_05935 [Candidatus Sumerlaeota bacterium]|nr:hypothetical protein [Candidatus Sumerlaeota bacterium]